MCAVVWLAVLAAGLLACGDKGTGPSTPGRVVLDVRYADPGAAAAAKAVAALRMDRMAAMAQQNGATVRQQELSYEAGTWKGTLKLPSGTYRIAVEAFKADRVRWRGQTSVTLAGGRTVTAVIELASTNRAPVLTGIGDQQVTEGGTLRLGLSASDADEDELTYSMSGVSVRRLVEPANLHLDPDPRSGRHLPDDLHRVRRPGGQRPRDDHHHRHRGGRDRPDQPGAGADRDRRSAGGGGRHAAVELERQRRRRGRPDVCGLRATRRRLPCGQHLHLDPRPTIRPAPTG